MNITASTQRKAIKTDPLGNTVQSVSPLVHSPNFPETLLLYSDRSIFKATTERDSLVDQSITLIPIRTSKVEQQ